MARGPSLTGVAALCLLLVLAAFVARRIEDAHGRAPDHALRLRP